MVLTGQEEPKQDAEKENDYQYDGDHGEEYHEESLLPI